ncbi:MAG: hypothetical protein AB9882_08175 [Ignavibacteriaceae bacterium]
MDKAAAEEKAKTLTDRIEDFSNRKIMDREALSDILALSVVSDKEKELRELAFTAKYIQGILRGAKKAAGNPEINNLEFLKGELGEHIQKFAGMLRGLIPPLPESDKLNKKYFGENVNSFADIQTLISDLEWVKMFLNDGNGLE